MSILAEEPDGREEEDLDSCTSEEAREDRLDEFVPLNEGIMESGLILRQLDGDTNPDNLLEKGNNSMYLAVAFDMNRAGGFRRYGVG